MKHFDGVFLQEKDTLLTLFCLSCEKFYNAVAELPSLTPGTHFLE